MTLRALVGRASAAKITRVSRTKVGQCRSQTMAEAAVAMLQVAMTSQYAKYYPYKNPLNQLGALNRAVHWFVEIDPAQ